MGMKPARPTKAALAAAADKRVPDLIARGLTVLFCGINPGLYSAATGHHFARPGNRFWPALFTGGFTPRLLSPAEEQELLVYGLGITNIAQRATAAASELSAAELVRGARALELKVKRSRPAYLAVLGVQAYRTAFAEPSAGLGLQPRTIGRTRIWLLPSPSGLNAHYTPKQFGQLFAELRTHAGIARRSPG